MLLIEYSNRANWIQEEHPTGGEFDHAPEIGQIIPFRIESGNSSR